MSYQLVLQWPAPARSSIEGLLGIEEQLVAGLQEGHEVDGHDFGSGEMNIFIATDNPKRAFDEVRRILLGSESWQDLRAAYRAEGGDSYTILWPKDLESFSVA